MDCIKGYFMIRETNPVDMLDVFLNVIVYQSLHASIRITHFYRMTHIWSCVLVVDLYGGMLQLFIVHFLLFIIDLGLKGFMQVFVLAIIVFALLSCIFFHCLVMRCVTDICAWLFKNISLKKSQAAGS